MKNAKNPFLSKPKFEKKTIGNDDIGKIELPSYKGLIAGEQEALEEIGEAMPEPFSEASKLAIKIRFAHNLPDTETLFCFDVVANSNWEEEQKSTIEADRDSGKISKKEAEKRLSDLAIKAEQFLRLRIEHSPEIAELNQRLRKANRVKRKAVVTAMLKYRGSILLREDLKKLRTPPFSNEDRDRADEIEATIESLDNWSETDTNQLHNDLVEELWKFAQYEMSGGKEEAEPPTAEAVGKLPNLPEDPELTGETSTGDFGDTGLTTSALVLTTS